MKPLDVAGSWVAAPIAQGQTFAVLWRPEEVNTAEVEMKNFSSFVNVKFKPFTGTEPQSYRLAYYFGSMTSEQLKAARRGMLAR